jgi:putative endonuclease
MGYRNRALGKLGENLAARFLARKGYGIIGRNVKTFVGEIDIVAREKPFIVFVEIKTRKNTSFGPPYLSVTEKKKRKLVQCALCYLKGRDALDGPWRIDIISIELDELNGLVKKIEHFENAVEE